MNVQMHLEIHIIVLNVRIWKTKQELQLEKDVWKMKKHSVYKNLCSLGQNNLLNNGNMCHCSKEDIAENKRGYNKGKLETIVIYMFI
jgi:hypothetical protein